MQCLLCESDEIQITATLPATQLIRDWQDQFGINVSQDVTGSTVSLYRCLHCRLQFFDPELAGGESLYAQLQRLSGYYVQGKWEHLTAAAEIGPSECVLEVGCGRGEFLSLLRQRNVREILGLETNLAAVEEAKRLGLPIEYGDIRDFAQTMREQFDVVCSFQVLEHVPTPSQFIESCIELLRPGGRLIIGVPNADSFLRHRYELLDMPPHHITRWTSVSLQALAAKHDLSVQRMYFEPLARHHVTPFLDAHAARLLPFGIARLLKISAILPLMTQVVMAMQIRRFLRGHTVYVSYSKV